MDYKKKSIITISLIVVIMISVGIVININAGITGTTVKKSRCVENIDCDDNNVCTEDICLYADSPSANCVHKQIENCKK